MLANPAPLVGNVSAIKPLDAAPASIGERMLRDIVSMVAHGIVAAGRIVVSSESHRRDGQLRSQAHMYRS